MNAATLWACFLACALLTACADAAQQLDHGVVDAHQVDAQQLDHAVVDAHQVDAQQLDHAVVDAHQVEDAGRPCSGTNPCPWGLVCVARADDAGQVLTAFCEPP